MHDYRRLVRGAGFALRIVIVPAVLLAAVVVKAQAQNAGQGQEISQQRQENSSQTEDGKSVKHPPPPLFPLHRRGMYKNALGIEVIDATPQSPPLEVDDPGVPDKGQYEINFTSEAALSNQTRAFDFLLVDANYGALPKIFGHELPTQIKLECPLAAEDIRGGRLNVGIGTALFGLKFNFYSNEHTGASAAVYPQIKFAVPGTDATHKDLAEPGQTLIFPLLVRKEFKYLTLVANAAVNQPLHDAHRDATATLGLAVGRAFTRHLAGMAEVRGDSTFDFTRDRLVVVNFGMMRRLRDDVLVFINVGHSVFSDNRYGQLYAGIGVKLLLAPGDGHNPRQNPF